jgi:hypothetical protein
MSTGTIESYDQVGKREDVSDIITNISPTKTPFVTMIGTESIHNTLHQWQEDSLMAVSATPLIEGAAAPTPTWQATVMRNNNTQIFSLTAQASGTTDAIKTYGRSKELAYQLGLRAAENKRNLEYAMVGTQQAQTVGNDTTARAFAGAQAQVNTSVTLYANNGAGGTFGTNGTGTAALNETMILNVCQQLYTNGTEPTVLLIKPGDALKVAAFTAATGRTRYLDAKQTTLVNVVDVYVTPFSGDGLKVVLDRFINTTDAFIFEPDMWKRLVLRNWFREKLAITGDFTEVMLVGEFSLKHRNWSASGRITTLL